MVHFIACCQESNLKHRTSASGRTRHRWSVSLAHDRCLLLLFEGPCRINHSLKLDEVFASISPGGSRCCMRSRACSHRNHPSVWHLAKALVFGVAMIRMALVRRMSMATTTRDLMAGLVALGSPLPLVSAVAPALNLQWPWTSTAGWLLPSVPGALNSEGLIASRPA